MKRWISLFLTAGIVLATAITGCSFDSTKKIRIGEVTRSLFYAPQYVAIEKGFFKEEGLDVEVTTTWGGDKTMTALLSDRIDVALVGSETSIYVDSQGASDRVVNFAQLTQTDGTFLVSRKPASNFSWDQLKGTVFLSQRQGSMPRMVGEFVLKKHGINPQKDLRLIQNIEFKNIPSAFSSGTGEFVQLFEPQASQFEKAGVGHVIASFGKESGIVPYTAYMTKQSYLTNNRDLMQKFTHAIYKSQTWVASHTAKEISDTIAPYFNDINKEILVNSVRRYQEQGSYATDPILDENEWNNLQNIMQEAGELKQRVDYAKLVDTTLAKSAKEGK